ncbi:TadE family protein [Actinophytocola gossypii]|uniref:Pilus assembly protein n=1 Tax=Actinophytocola gossypii TaxID=2812003 RepID=A0ABT2J3S1_9PSEU|nr:TadE family protein [Actinophytocola gossypii]MCT2582501.1 pilus assembly protein [Actinophytocola gossypii]
MADVRRGRDNDSGMVTVEAAIALTAFIAVLGIALGAISAAIDQLRCTDAAREAARLTARGESDKATSAARHIAPDGATIHVTTDGEEIHVSVTATPFPGIDLHADAYAIAEPAPAPSP